MGGGSFEGEGQASMATRIWPPLASTSSDGLAAEWKFTLASIVLKSIGEKPKGPSINYVA